MNTFSEKERELIIARLEVASPELHFSSGDSSESYTRDEIIQHIKNADTIGNAFIKVELDFLRALKNGTLMNQLVTS